MFLLPPLVTCICGAQFRERKRRPCPCCKSINRVISVTAHDQLSAKDKAN